MLQRSEVTFFFSCCATLQRSEEGDDSHAPIAFFLFFSCYRTVTQRSRFFFLFSCCRVAAQRSRLFFSCCRSATQQSRFFFPLVIVLQRNEVTFSFFFLLPRCSAAKSLSFFFLL